MANRPEPAAQPGTLYVVATPIGNLGDLTPRARDTLAAVDRIAAEDTRHTGQLLRAFGIDRPLLSLHAHNETERSAALIAALQEGQSIALVSDAGTPLISDPGFDLIAAARAHGITTIAIPGACAAIAALSVAGLPADRFTFEGFPAAKSQARRAQFEQLLHEPRTLIFYEAPHRIVETLADLAAIFGAGRLASVSRELTKRFETTYRGTLGELAAQAQADADMARGELVIVVAGAAIEAESIPVDATRVLRALCEELPPAQAAKLAARITGLRRNDLYALALTMSERAGK